MRKWLAGLAAAALFAGGLYWAFAIYPTRVFRGAIDAAIAALPAGYAASYDEARYSLFSGRGTLTGVAVHGGAADPFALTLDTLTLSHPASDLAAAWARAAARPQDVTPELTLPVADELLASGIAWRDADEKATLASAEIAKPRIYPWALLRPGVPSVAEARAGLLARTHPPEPGDFLPLLRAEARLAMGFGYDGYKAQKLAADMSIPAAGNVPAADISYSIEKLTSGRYERGRLETSALEGLTTRSTAWGSLGIARAEINGVDLGNALTALLDGKDLPREILDGVTLKRMAYGPMSVQAPAGAPSMLGTFELANVAFTQGLLVSADLAFDGVRLEAAQIANLDATETFGKLGLDAMTLDFGLGYRWDLPKGRIAVENATLAVHELGALTLSFEVSDAGSPADLLAKARLVHAVLRYKDASLAGRILAMAADRKGEDAATMRRNLIAAMEQIEGTPGVPPATVAAARAAADFLNAPQSLTVELAPPAPVPLLAFFAIATIPPEKLVPVLGLSIAANR